MDALLLAAVLPEIADELTGRPVTKVEAVGKYAVLLRFGGARRDLLVSAHPELSRLGLVAEPPALGDPRPASDALREPLLRAILVGAAAEPAGRVARLRFRAERGRHADPVLVAELIPRFANIVLLGNDERILWCRREFEGTARPREVVTGQRWIAPEPEPGLRFAELDEATIAARLAEGDGPLHRRLPRGWGGGSIGPARVLEEAGLDVAARLGALARAVSNGEVRPHLLRRSADGAMRVFPADPGDLPGWERLDAGGPNALVDAYYRYLESEESSETLLADLRRTLARRRARAAKALRTIEARLAEADREAEIRAHADLLAAHLGLVRRGLRSVRLPAFDGSGEIEIPLDPKKDARGNLEALFKKARRVARGREELVTQRAIQAAEIGEADRGLEATDPPPDADALRELAARFAPEVLAAADRGRLAAGGPGGSRGPQPGASAELATEARERHPSLPDGFAPRVYELPGGWIVWVGRNAKQNDELTHRRASPRDLWFHARGAQGSHTVLRMASGKGEPPREIVRMAASIAAWHSKARNSSLVPVAYTEKRHVRRPRKAPTGTALMMREKVLMVEPGLPEGADD